MQQAFRLGPAGFGPLIAPQNHGAPQTATRLWLPSDLATAPKAWLDANALTGADGSTVSTFTDQEGHFDATLASGTGPVLRYAAQNSLKVVEFTTASAAKMTFSSSLMNGATQGCFFAVLKLKNDPTLNGAAGGDAAAILDAFTSDTGSNLGSHHPYSDGVFYDHFGVSTRQTLGDPTPSFSSTYRLFNCEITSGGTYTNRIDATQFFQAVSQTVDFGAKTRNLAYTLGGGAFDFYLNGYVAEVLILDYVPSSTELAQIEGYLAWRWGEQANLPGGHTYVAAAPTTAGSSGSPDVTLALTGQTVTASQGTLAPTVSFALAGQPLSVTRGALVATTGVTLTGQALTVSQGALTPALTLALAGSGVVANQGALTPAFSVTLAGQALVASRGTILPSLSLPLLGSGITVTKGNVSVTGDVTIALTGQTISASAGSLTPTTNLALTGNGITGSQGTITAGLSAALVGSLIRARAGTLRGTVYIAPLTAPILAGWHEHQPAAESWAPNDNSGGTAWRSRTKGRSTW